VLRFMEPVDLFKNLVVALSLPIAVRWWLVLISFLRKTAQLPWKITGCIW
jgi:hypothetical protein